jgi:undecaprenyl-diphosphatase
LIPLIFNFDGGINDSLFFDVTLHLGTFLSVLLFFYKDWIRLIKGFFVSVKRRKAQTADEKMIWYIIFATIPAAAAGLFFEETIDGLFHAGGFSSILYITIPLTLVSFVMIFSEKLSSKEKSAADITFKDALIIGLTQALALIPGVSRSGITICAGLFLGYKREESAKFSFLLSTPIIFGAFLLKFIKTYKMLSTDEMNMYLIGATLSGIVGYISIKYMLKFLKNERLNVFAYYRIALAILLVVLFFYR